MKKIISAIIAVAITCSAIPAYAYSSSDYLAKATELRTLIEECKGLGINTQYEEIDANIIEVYAERIANFASGVASGISAKQEADLNSLKSELDKLVSYANCRDMITKADIDLLVCKSAESRGGNLPIEPKASP